MTGEPDIAVPARAIGDPARARIVSALLGGVGLPAGELARTVGLSASTTSEHLAVLATAGIVVAERDGRRRNYRLASAAVAHAVEALQAISPTTEVRSLRQHRATRDLREARTCYDHLAGDLGLRVTDLLRRHHVVGDLTAGCVAGAPEPFPDGAVVAAFGIRPPRGRRPWARGCLDWTGRRPHLGGQIGAQILTTVRADGWIATRPGSRAVRLTDTGQERMRELEAL